MACRRGGTSWTGGGGFRGGGFHAAAPAFGGTCIDPLEWERAEAELASAYRATLQLERVRYIGGLSIIMDELADP